MALPAGKLPPELLAEFIRDLPLAGPDVVVGAAVGEDAAVVDVGDRYLVLAADPVTLSARPGSVAVQINANDVAVMGAEPRWLLATILLPPGSTADTARDLMRDLIGACAEHEIALIGGHTEITPAVTQPVVAATMVGEVAPDRLVRGGGARPGDALLLAGPIAVEGTAILASDFDDELRRSGVPSEVIEQAARLFIEPGISVVPAARTLMETILPHAMHDPTEGGLLSAAWEMGTAAGAGIQVDADSVPILPACRAICGTLELDPLGLLASGSLLAAVAREDVDTAEDVLRSQGIETAVIGQFLSRGEASIVRASGVNGPLLPPPRDELARWIEGHSLGAAR